MLVQHDTDQLTFDKMIKLSILLISKIQLANQNRFKNYNINFFPNNIVAHMQRWSYEIAQSGWMYDWLFKLQNRSFEY